ncbi:hypothetical protein CYMTET_31715 [Cymbomonas tetramitiformis]|uniref:Uncharacterized protein n=1 Tax=Cymbomonas tetramitiformis TaxID=36881 RepID=A0AAE0FHA9_9CHLO|nr:hypothetical protein CYMTET_31715 [Cymbomonas tetramitiformis]
MRNLERSSAGQTLKPPSLAFDSTRAMSRALNKSPVYTAKRDFKLSWHRSFPGSIPVRTQPSGQSTDCRMSYACGRISRCWRQECKPRRRLVRLGSRGVRVEANFDPPTSYGQGPLREFLPEDFELVKKLGTVVIKEVFEVRDYSRPLAEPVVIDSSPGPSVIHLYAARYMPSAPFDAPVSVLLKEFPGPMAKYGDQEVLIYNHLLRSARADTAASQDLNAFISLEPSPGRDFAPLASLCGSFTSLCIPQDDAEDACNEGEDSTWLVQRYEQPLPLSGYPTLPQRLPRQEEGLKGWFQQKLQREDPVGLKWETGWVAMKQGLSGEWPDGWR